MVKREDKPASRAVVGGFGPRRQPGSRTPSGRPRSARRWTAAVALHVQQQLLHMMELKQKGKEEVVADRKAVSLYVQERRYLGNRKSRELWRTST